MLHYGFICQNPENGRRYVADVRARDLFSARDSVPRGSILYYLGINGIPASARENAVRTANALR